MSVSKQRRLMNRLFFPEDRVIKKPMPLWIDELINRLSDKKPEHDRYHILAEVYNQSALIYSQLGRLSEAKELCYTQIHRFIVWRSQEKNRDITKYILQPWINLCRLDRIEGDISGLFSKLHYISRIKPLYKSICKDTEFHNVYLLCRLLEPVKFYLHQRKYVELLDFIDRNWETSISFQKQILYEAKLLCIANDKSREVVLNHLDEWLAYVHSSSIHFYLLRFYELYVVMNYKNVNSLKIKLIDISLKKLQMCYVNINDLVFSISLALLLYEEDHGEALMLMRYCLDASLALNDDGFLADVLLYLYRWEDSIDSRNRIKNQIIDHLSSSHYLYSQQKLSCIVTKKRVQKCVNNSINSKLSLLYNELQSVSV